MGYDKFSEQALFLVCTKTESKQESWFESSFHVHLFIQRRIAINVLRKPLVENCGNMHNFMYSTSRIKTSCITSETKSVQNVISGISPTLFENVSACTLQQKRE